MDPGPRPLAGRDAVIAAGGALLVVGGGLSWPTSSRRGRAAARAARSGPSGAGIASAGLWFAVVLALGALMAANRVHPFLEVNRMRLIAAHGAVAIVGWIGGTIVAMALRLAPMFALAHGYRRGPGSRRSSPGTRRSSRSPSASGSGIAALAAAGGALLLGACGLARLVRRGRRPAPPPPPRGAARPPGPRPRLGGRGACLMLGAWAGAGDPYRAAIPAALLAVVGMGAGITSGHLFKVVPMLVWTGRFARLAGTPGAPRLSDLYPARSRPPSRSHSPRAWRCWPVDGPGSAAPARAPGPSCWWRRRSRWRCGGGLRPRTGPRPARPAPTPPVDRSIRRSTHPRRHDHDRTDHHLLDVREMAPRERHPTILSTFDALRRARRSSW